MKRLISFVFVRCFVLTMFNEEAYLTKISTHHKTLKLFSSIMKSRSKLFLEPTSTKQRGSILRLTNYELDALPTSPCRPSYFVVAINVSRLSMHVQHYMG